MKSINLEVSKFVGVYQHLNGVSTIRFNTLDLVRCSISIGYSSWKNVLFRNKRSYMESLYNSIGTLAYTKSENGNLAFAQNFYILDQSEKSPITYRMGMTITKLVAERVLHIPWLLHIDKLVEQGIVSITSGSKERGDLAGLDNTNKWHVLESKGRSYKPSQTEIQHGKNQAGRITAINNIVPATKSVCISYLQNSSTYTQLIDPPNGNDDQPTSWEIDRSNFILFYYKSFLNHLKNFDYKIFKYNVGGNVYKFFLYDSSKNTGIKIGILCKVVEKIKVESLEFEEFLHQYQTDLDEHNKIYDGNNDINVSLGMDGIIVIGTDKS